MKINSILCGDCIEKLKTIPAESVDMVFADPPYFMGTAGNLKRADGTLFQGCMENWDKFQGYDDYFHFSYLWINEIKRIMKENASFWVIGSFQNIFQIGFILQKMGFWILNDVIWQKPNAPPNFNGTRFQNAHETLIWCTKSSGAKYTFNYKTMKALNGNKQAKSVWNIGICIGPERLKDEQGQKIHATQKPKELLYNIILASTKPKDIILDPFFGTGTTGAVAKELGRNFIGIEKEESYCQAALKRIQAVIPNENDLTNLKAEIKPPKVSIGELIESGFLKHGQSLYDKKGAFKGILQKNGMVEFMDHTLSIHQMAAFILNRPTFNGWDYFFIQKENQLISINNLRYDYIEKFKD